MPLVHSWQTEDGEGQNKKRKRQARITVSDDPTARSSARSSVISQPLITLVERKNTCTRTAHAHTDSCKKIVVFETKCFG